MLSILYEKQKDFNKNRVYGLNGYAEPTAARSAALRGKPRPIEEVIQIVTILSGEISFTKTDANLPEGL